ncbi:class I SAM-dependent methyltransferase [Candidatus Marinarcus aquaticus]|nr:class I SAM-dependent methyltransferase [Candidatus Marinarcus aquaticus]
MMERLCHYFSYKLIPILTGSIHQPDVYVTDGFFLNWRQMKKSILKASHYVKGKCLDIGAGQAPYKKYLEEKCTEYIISDSSLTHKEMFKASDVQFVNAEATSLPFASETMDTVILTQVLEHVFDYQDVIIEAKRVLKKEGILLLSVPFIYQAHAQPYDFFRFSEFGLKTLLEKNGFEVIEFHYQGYLGTTLISIINGYIWDRTSKFRCFRNIVCLPIILPIFVFNNIIGLFLDTFKAQSFSPNFFVICRNRD